MNTAMMAGALALAGIGAQGAEKTAYQVAVYLQDQQLADPVLLARAKALATSMFAGIGVGLKWKLGAPPPAHARQAAPDAEIVVRFATRTPANLHPGAPAFAFPYAPRSEVRITILYDRVLTPVAGDLNAGAALLGHVLAHEITHVLQAVTRHSQEGVMKAQWTPEDRMQMRKGPLPFTAHDVQLIQLGLVKSNP